MVQAEIGVGVVGVNATSRWAGVSHIPAIKGLAGVRLAAVATRNAQSAKQAAEAFGADRWYADPLEMMRDERIGIVTVTVKVPAHRDLVLAALAAGKAVYCEAPLGSSLPETEVLAGAVRSQHTAIGFQGRLNPTVRRAAEIVASGKIGRPLSARVLSTTSGFGPKMASNDDYYNKAAAGSNLLTVTTAHTLDLVEGLLGPITEVDARTETRWPSVELTDTGTLSQREVPDHVDVLGKTQSGAVFAAQMLAGVAPEQGEFRLVIRASEGWLSLTGDHPYGFQAGDPKLAASVAFAPPEAPAVASGGFQGAAMNIAEVYAGLVDDLRTGAYSTPGFDHALHVARLTEAVRLAGENGRRQTLAA
ncbi:MAG TPA: Gfo/Idh/MocA family oxidoreductase [Caulobacteraceae bacterium]|jgi:predicted dehydrogenase